MQRRSSIDNNYCSIAVIASWGWTIYKIFNKEGRGFFQVSFYMIMAKYWLSQEQRAKLENLLSEWKKK